MQWQPPQTFMLEEIDDQLAQKAKTHYPAHAHADKPNHTEGDTEHN